MASSAANYPLNTMRRLWRAVQAYRDPQRKRVKPWFAANGDKTLRLRYDLTPKSIVFDVGGYEGNWASDIYAMYCCTVHVFEPVPAFAEAMRARFARNPQIQVWPFGLDAVDRKMSISMASDGSSVYRVAGARTEHVQLRGFAGFLAEQGIKGIDLLKINIEGGEYDLLEHILDRGLQRQITDIQVQFHDYLPDARQRMAAIQRGLTQTHAPTYRYEFVWENWHLRGEQPQ